MAQVNEYVLSFGSFTFSDTYAMYTQTTIVYW